MQRTLEKRKKRVARRVTPGHCNLKASFRGWFERSKAEGASDLVCRRAGVLAMKNSTPEVPEF